MVQRNLLFLQSDTNKYAAILDYCSDCAPLLCSEVPLSLSGQFCLREKFRTTSILKRVVIGGFIPKDFYAHRQVFVPTHFLYLYCESCVIIFHLCEILIHSRLLHNSSSTLGQTDTQCPWMHKINNLCSFCDKVIRLFLTHSLSWTKPTHTSKFPWILKY